MKECAGRGDRTRGRLHAKQTLSVFVSNYEQNWSDSEEIMASKVGVPPLKCQVSENLSMLKVKHPVV